MKQVPNLLPFSFSSFSWNLGINDLKMVLKSFPGRSFRKTCKMGGFCFNLQAMEYIISMVSCSGSSAVAPELHPISTIFRHFGKPSSHSFVMHSSRIGLVVKITFFYITKEVLVRKLTNLFTQLTYSCFK